VFNFYYKAVFRLGKRNKSKRFVQQGKDAVTKHAEQFPYRSTYAEAEARQIDFMKESSLGGIE
jgi:hypothetical protein